MATQKQTQAARRNVVKAKDAARRKRTISNLPASTRRDLGHQAAMARGRGGQAGRSYEDRTRAQLYEVAHEHDVATKNFGNGLLALAAATDQA